MEAGDHEYLGQRHPLDLISVEKSCLHFLVIRDTPVVGIALISRINTVALWTFHHQIQKASRHFLHPISELDKTKTQMSLTLTCDVF
jgi:hypothetical protein